MRETRDTRNTTTVQTRAKVATDPKSALEFATPGTLTHEEERVVRMRTGASVDPRTPHELKGQSNPELRAKLAMIEALAMDALSRPAPAKPTAAPSTVSNPTKAHIIARLRGGK